MRAIIKLYLFAEEIWFKLPEKIRFLLVGGFNTVFAYSLLAVLLWSFEKINQSFALNLSEALVANISLLTQYAITVNVSFLTMRYYVFRSHGDWHKEFFKAWSVYIFIYLTNAPVLTFLMVVLGLSALISQAIYLTFSTITTFLLHKYYSFRPKKID